MRPTLAVGPSGALLQRTQPIAEVSLCKSHTGIACCTMCAMRSPVQVASTDVERATEEAQRDPEGRE